jgi:hypothetical protein
MRWAGRSAEARGTFLPILNSDEAFFAFRILSDTFGEGKLERMFFVDRASALADLGAAQHKD